MFFGVKRRKSKAGKVFEEEAASGKGIVL